MKKYKEKCACPKCGTVALHISKYFPYKITYDSLFLILYGIKKYVEESEYIERTCTKCGHVFKQETKDTPYYWKYSSGEESCDLCGEVLSEK